MRESTIARNNYVHELYKEIMKSLGEFKYYIAKGYVYQKIREKTHLSIRTIQRILNHTEPQMLFG